jgi:hypothetical protein
MSEAKHVGRMPCWHYVEIFKQLAVGDHKKLGI